MPHEQPPEPAVTRTDNPVRIPSPETMTATQDVATRPASPFPITAAIELPGFTLVRELGHGGMGVVYLAQQHNPKRSVAVKMVLAGTTAGPELLERFRLEGEAIARLSHTGIVQVFACDQADKVPFLVLEFIDGTSLEKVPVPVAPDRAAELLEAIARAIGYAHSKGIVHRDLKPGNILLTSAGEPKVTDFGLAKFDAALAPTLNDEHATTRSGAILGSPRYMAPEQASGKIAAIGPATDVHALGLILYEVLTGKPAFAGDTLLDTLDKVRTAEPAPPRSVAPSVPRDLETICLMCLRKVPEKRYAGAVDLADDLRRWRAGEPILARPVPWWERAQKWVRRNPDEALVWGVIWLLLPTMLILIGLNAPLAAFLCGLNAALGVVLVLAKSWRRVGIVGLTAVVFMLEWWVCVGHNFAHTIVLASREMPNPLGARGMSARIPRSPSDGLTDTSDWVSVLWELFRTREEFCFIIGYWFVGLAGGLAGRWAGRRWHLPIWDVIGRGSIAAGCGIVVAMLPAIALDLGGTTASRAITLLFAAGGAVSGCIVWAWSSATPNPDGGSGSDSGLTPTTPL